MAAGRRREYHPPPVGRVNRIGVDRLWRGAVAPDRMAASQRPGAAPLPGLHSSKFLPEPAATLRTGVVAMTSAALDLLRR